MLKIDKAVVDMLKKQYPEGTEVELVKMDDIQAPPAGTKGKVRFVDDLGTVHISWDTGSGLGAVYGVDVIRKVG